MLKKSGIAPAPGARSEMAYLRLPTMQYKIGNVIRTWRRRIIQYINKITPDIKYILNK